MTGLEKGSILTLLIVLTLHVLEPCYRKRILLKFDISFFRLQIKYVLGTSIILQREIKMTTLTNFIITFCTKDKTIKKTSKASFQFVVSPIVISLNFTFFKRINFNILNMLIHFEEHKGCLSVSQNMDIFLLLCISLKFYCGERP
jgi:hypothetical protein